MHPYCWWESIFFLLCEHTTLGINLRTSTSGIAYKCTNVHNSKVEVFPWAPHVFAPGRRCSCSVLLQRFRAMSVAAPPVPPGEHGQHQTEDGRGPGLVSHHGRKHCAVSRQHEPYISKHRCILFFQNERRLGMVRHMAKGCKGTSLHSKRRTCSFENPILRR